MSAPDATAIVLARAGSKGLPGKNVRPVAGKPCVAWTLEAALASRAVGRVALSSDDEMALGVARRLGVLVHRRASKLASDTATVDAAVRSALVDLDGARASDDALGAVVMLYGNVPVRPADLIDRALDLLRESGCDSVQSYTQVGKAHPWWQVRVDAGDGRVSAWEGEELFGGVYRRQDLPPAFVPDGGVVALRRGALFGAGDGPHAFMGRDRRGVTTRAGEVVDIDTEIDLRVAEAILLERVGGGAGDGARRVG